MSNRPLISLENVTMRIRDTRYLSDTSWRVGEGESWVVLGPNGSGKTTLVGALFGRTPIVKGKVVYHFLPNGKGFTQFLWALPILHVDADGEGRVLDPADRGPTTR
jgi:ABC-type molybdenum transport system ATPase subunit/photorepair protein PhrA